MSKYNISPSEIRTALTATSNATKGFAKDLKPLSGHVSAIATACGNSGAIVPALNGLFGKEQKDLANMGTHIEACLTGAAAATTAYVDGDLEMMKTYQNNAAKAKVSKIPH